MYGKVNVLVGFYFLLNLINLTISLREIRIGKFIAICFANTHKERAKKITIDAGNFSANFSFCLLICRLFFNFFVANFANYLTTIE